MTWLTGWRQSHEHWQNHSDVSDGRLRYRDPVCGAGELDRIDCGMSEKPICHVTRYEMRKVARYVAEAELDDGVTADSLWRKIEEARESWLAHKGEVLREENGKLQLHISRDDRVADLEMETRESEAGQLHFLRLREPLERNQFFETTIQCAKSESMLALDAELQLGYETARLSPASFEARCPWLIRTIFELDAPWTVGNTEVPTEATELRSQAEGEQLADQIIDLDRSLPYIVVSELEKLTLHPKLVSRLAHQLCGLAKVFRISNYASWGLTEQLGKMWSCYNGAIRIYWPFRKEERNPYRHELWTRSRLMRGTADTKEAAKRIEQQLRRTILGLSTITIPSSELVEEVHRTYRREKRDSRLEKAQGASEWRQLAEEFADRAQEADDLESKNETLRARVEEQQKVIQFLQQERSPEDAEVDDLVKPETDVPPETVEEAVSRAREELHHTLQFGDDVVDGVKGLADDAGPPESILRHLQMLSDVAEELQDSDSLGTSIINWLKEKNVNASRESETIRNSEHEMQKRTWHDGQGRRAFEHHTKPNDGAPPHRCVRIYFDWAGERRKIIVGWVGRHP